MPLGDTAISIELGQTIDPTVNALVHALDRELVTTGRPALHGIVETVPTYHSLVVHHDPLKIELRELETELRSGTSETLERVTPVRDTANANSTAVEIPIAYGGDAGPDLADVARHAGLTEDDVIQRHLKGEYQVAMLGFAPGFPYLVGMDPALACPRLPTPRVRVPAGSVAIADAQTGIYPYAMPGGWRVIGRTQMSLFDPAADPPTALQPGVRARFVRVEPSALTRESEIHEDVGQPSRAIRVVEPGVQATIQDLGRYGHQRYGVPPSGAADDDALVRGNLAVSNRSDAAAVEVTAGDAEFEFTTATRFAVTGGDAVPTLGDRPIRREHPMDAAPHDRLRIGLIRNGFRAYLCVAGGVAVPTVLGSRSTYLPGTFGGFWGRALRADDLVPLGDAGASASQLHNARQASPGDDGMRSSNATAGAVIELPFVAGGEWDDLAAGIQREFLERQWEVSHQSNRIGLRLEGQPLDGPHWSQPFVSDGTVTGMVQLPPDGSPIVLMTDRQTTGGYPRLGAVARVGHHLLGQARAGDVIAFRLVSVAEAQEAWRRHPRATERPRSSVP